MIASSIVAAALVRGASTPKTPVASSGSANGEGWTAPGVTSILGEPFDPDRIIAAALEIELRDRVHLAARIVVRKPKRPNPAPESGARFRPP